MNIRVLLQDGHIEVMNIEDYVKGVLPREWLAGWHANSLRVGAVCARTYGLYAIHTAPAGRQWDICSTTA